VVSGHGDEGDEKELASGNDEKGRSTCYSLTYFRLKVGTDEHSKTCCYNQLEPNFDNIKISVLVV
jgi:hypothetical protein